MAPRKPLVPKKPTPATKPEPAILTVEAAREIAEETPTPPEPIVEAEAPVLEPDEVIPAAPAPKVFNSNKSGTARRVLHVRCIQSSQIGAMSTALDEKKHQLEMELRPDLGGVLVSYGGAHAGPIAKEREFIVPFSNIAHIELSVE